MLLQFWGATKTVTGSLHYVEAKGKRFILECGLYQGHRDEADTINRNIPVKHPETLDYLFLSHAHIDHSGNIPTDEECKGKEDGETELSRCEEQKFPFYFSTQNRSNNQTTHTSPEEPSSKCNTEREFVTVIDNEEFSHKNNLRYHR